MTSALGTPMKTVTFKLPPNTSSRTATPEREREKERLFSPTSRATPEREREKERVFSPTSRATPEREKEKESTFSPTSRVTPERERERERIFSPTSGARAAQHNSLHAYTQPESLLVDIRGGPGRQGVTSELLARPRTVHPRRLRQMQRELEDQQQQQRPQSRPGSDLQAVLSRQDTITLAPGDTLKTRDRSPLVERQRMTAHVASHVRERSNSISHDHVRLIKYEVAKLREHLLKVEEEIKNLNRGRHTLELAIQEVRKALSVNQQSLSTQQKKTRRSGDPVVKLLREEAQVLSKGKRSVEAHLQTVKGHLQALDSSRKTLKAKISSFSRALELDAQNFKLYEGPVSVHSTTVSRQRQYANVCPLPRSRTEDEAAAQLCSKVLEVVTASKNVRREIKALVVSVQAHMMEAHDKISSTIARNAEEAKAHKRDILLERGQVRLAQNSAQHQKHTEEIALGIALGPISDKHRSVSEKADRPLSRVRPLSATEERTSFKTTTSTLSRQLSATSVRSSEMGETEMRLARKLRERAQSAILDSETLRIRKISLDNRWVQ